MTLMDTCRDPAATEDRILVFDAFGPIGFVMKFAADDGSRIAGFELLGRQRTTKAAAAVAALGLYD